MGGGMTDEAQPFGGVGGHGSQLGSLGSRGDRRSQVQKRIPHLTGESGLETFPTQPLFQSIRTGRPVRDLYQLSFH